MARKPVIEEMGGTFDEMYAGVPPWDIGKPQAEVVRLASEGAFEGSVLDAGCGTGENTMFLAGRGVEAVGLDGAPRAIEKARAKSNARNSKATFVLGDALDLKALGRPFDRVLDCGLFHTFEDKERAAYVRELAGVVRKGGRLYVLCFSEHEPGDWGPRRVTQAEIRSSFGPPFKVESIVASTFESHLGAAKAWLSTIVRG